jgi:amino acid transporter
VSHHPRRRHVKLHLGTLGPLLCWAVVFADIGTSIYYVPGILYGQGFTTRSAIFVVLVESVFVLLCAKYAEVAWRYPEGGGVVTVASRALHPYVGLLGGLFILVDYYLTIAISALSGVYYLGVLIPGLAGQGVASAVTIAALLALGLLNVIGIRESARVSAVFAGLALAGQLIAMAVVLIHLGVHAFTGPVDRVRHGPALTPLFILTGYGAAFLAFSGLESVAQISPAMRSPRRRVAFRTMALVVLTIGLTSPLLTLWATTLQTLSTSAAQNQSISLLGAHFSGAAIGDYVAVSGALLLIFASNTAIIGAYHVFLALTRMGYLPRALEKTNRWRRTPHVAIAVAIALPVAIIAFSQGAIALLGDLYAFGLLGAFVITCLALDVVRWREGLNSLRSSAWFGVGVLTTLAVLTGWLVNLWAKPLATRFGGGLTIVGLLIGFATYRYNRHRRPAVFPLPYSPARAAESIGNEFRRRPADVLVILPESPELADPVLEEAAHRAAGRSAVFLYRGERHQHPRVARLYEVTDPYLKDYKAQDAFARAEQRTRKTIPSRRFVYVPGGLPGEILGRVWSEVFPKETIAAQDDGQALPAVALSHVRVRLINGVPVLHLVSGRRGREPVADARLGA